MDLSDDVILGKQLDPEIDDDIDQSDINEYSLMSFNMTEILRGIENKISRPHLDFLMENIDTDNNVFWTTVIKKISKIYSLTSLRLYLDRIIWTDNIEKDAILLLYYLKANLIEKLEYGTLPFNSDATRDVFEEFILKDANAPDIFKNCIKYIDAESFKKFIKRLFLEKQFDFIE